MKKTAAPIKFDSDDTEGSDLSYESSFDEKEDNQGASSSSFLLLFHYKTILLKDFCVFLLMTIRGAEEHQFVQGADGSLHADSP